MPANADDRVIKQFRKYLDEVRRPSMEIARDNAANTARRQAVVDRWRERFVTQSLEKLGVDLTPARKQQERDLKTMQTFQKEQWKKLKELGKARYQRQRTLRRQLTKRRKIVHRLRGSYTRCIPIATGIIPDSVITGDIDFGAGLETRTAAFDNRARIIVTCNNRGGCLFYLDYHFVWVAESDGLMESQASFYVNGAWETVNPGGCGTNNACAASLWMSMSAAQMTDPGDFRALEISPTETLFSVNESNSSSWGRSRSGLVMDDRDVLTIGGPTMEIVEGLPVLFTVTVGFDISSYGGGDVTMDFRSPSGSYQLTAGHVTCHVDDD